MLEYIVHWVFQKMSANENEYCYYRTFWNGFRVTESTFFKTIYQRINSHLFLFHIVIEQYITTSLHHTETWFHRIYILSQRYIYCLSAVSFYTYIIQPFGMRTHLLQCWLHIKSIVVSSLISCVLDSIFRSCCFRCLVCVCACVYKQAIISLFVMKSGI